MLWQPAQILSKTSSPHSPHRCSTTLPAPAERLLAALLLLLAVPVQLLDPSALLLAVVAACVAELRHERLLLALVLVLRMGTALLLVLKVTKRLGTGAASMLVTRAPQGVQGVLLVTVMEPPMRSALCPGMVAALTEVMGPCLGVLATVLLPGMATEGAATMIWSVSTASPPLLQVLPVEACPAAGLQSKQAGRVVPTVQEGVLPRHSAAPTACLPPASSGYQ